MLRNTSIVVVAIAMGLVGCSSGGGGDDGSSTTASTVGGTAGGTAGTATSGDTGGNTTDTATSGDAGGDTAGTATSGNTGGGTEGETTGDTAGTATGGTTGGTGAQGANPGTVPSPIIAELTTANFSDAELVRGHKVFAGNEQRDVFAGLEDLVENEYFNVSFPCTGPGTFEAFVAPQFVALGVGNVVGNFTWEFGASATDLDGEFEMEGTTVITGEADYGLFGDTFTIDHTVNGDVIVGTAVIQQLVVTRIVQFEECN